MRYFIRLSYNGIRYHGWQIQKSGLTVEEILEKCLSHLLGKSIDLIGGGRTDKGVHAKEFFAHLDSEKQLDKKLVIKLNAFLPKDIVVYGFYLVAPQAHARHSANSRTYLYRISLSKKTFYTELSWQCKYEQLNIDLMNKASELLQKYNNFSSFCKDNISNCYAKIKYAHWCYKGGKLLFEIKANRFLRNMVRSLIGTLLNIGKEKININQFCEIVDAKDRQRSGPSVPARGLFLKKICYPKAIFL
ncbi:putative tRNA pseudouridine synthase A [Candidatus Uzinura diaspidicola str. ASNER]|uniref:tRNA pseudouridine synthase A n=1 Tax=Candidatus Uzinura diaspidicola str. ASNER TaxID=1133592 RepID=L7VJD8_9FLAO|nr:putative tRNA pseudouridine synthase A [Candidatus Uzinura diaspidicola str. ASNER]